MSRYILQESLETKKRNKPVYFHEMTNIGPKSTTNLKEAERFGSLLEAMQCPAYHHWASFYEPVEVK